MTNKCINKFNKKWMRRYYNAKLNKHFEGDVKDGRGLQLIKFDFVIESQDSGKTVNL